MNRTQLTEEDYVALLRQERHMYAWCLERYGGLSHFDAESRAQAFYRYESPTSEHRGLLFHDLAWHWAMKHIFGTSVWRERPELTEPSAEYIAEDQLDT